TRRAFLKGSAMLAAPLAAAAAPAVAMAAAPDDTKDRLARLEDVEAVRALHRAFVAHVNARRPDDAAALFADPAKAGLDPAMTRRAAEAETVTLTADRQTATLTAACAVSTETEIDSDCTLAQMARLQGDGVIRATAARAISASFVKRD